MSLDVYLTGDGGGYSANITHNLGAMAREAGIYMHLWRPDEIGLTEANQLVAPLTGGLLALILEPSRFQSFNPQNGWGDWEGLVRFVAEYREACIASPKAKIEVSR